MRCAGNADLDTPAMDRLAETGTRFPNSYCTFPVCVPSRRSRLSGRMSHEFGMDVGEGLPPASRERSLGHIFDEAGYGE